MRAVRECYDRQSGNFTIIYPDPAFQKLVYIRIESEARKLLRHLR